MSPSQLQRRRRSLVRALTITGGAFLLFHGGAPGVSFAVTSAPGLLASGANSIATAPRPARTAACAKKKGGKKGGGGDDSASQGAAGDGDAEPEIDTGAMMNEWEDKMGQAVEVLKENLVGIRAGKATPAMITEVKVPAYGSESSIQEVGTVSATDTRTLTITCFDESVAPGVLKTLIDSNMGYSVSQDGPTVKIVVPELTTEKRKQYAKLAKDYAEKSRVAVRNVRQMAMKKVKGLSKKISEDIVKSMEKDVEATVKKHIGEVDNVFKKKEAELLKA